MACFLAAALIPLILCCFCFIQVIRVKLKRDMERKDIEQEQMAEQELISLFDGLEEVLTALSEDEEIRSGLESWGTGSQTGIYGQLYAETGVYREMAQFDLYSSEGECRYSTGAGSVHQNLPVYWGILKVAAAHPDDVIIRGVREYGGEEEILLRAVKAVRNREEECIGFLSAGMTAEDFEQVLQGIYGSQEGICILDRFCEPVYSAGTAARMDIGTVLRGKRMMGEALNLWKSK